MCAHEQPCEPKKVVIASTCVGQACPELPCCPSRASAAGGQQTSRELRPGRGPVRPRVDDEATCEDCYGMLDRLDVDSPLGPCACSYCALQLTACFASAATEINGDEARDQHCRAIVECGWSVGCTGSDCYCGVGVDRDTGLKNANEGRALGPCAYEIEAGSDCQQDDLRGVCVLSDQIRRGTVLHRAAVAASCIDGDPLSQGNVVPKCRGAMP